MTLMLILLIFIPFLIKVGITTIILFLILRAMGMDVSIKNSLVIAGFVGTTTFLNSFLAVGFLNIFASDFVILLIALRYVYDLDIFASILLSFLVFIPILIVEFLISFMITRLF